MHNKYRASEKDEESVIGESVATRFPVSTLYTTLIRVTARYRESEVKDSKQPREATATSWYVAATVPTVTAANNAKGKA
jgi:hypothetical protein